jgi:hypothetical protein
VPSTGSITIVTAEHVHAGGVEDVEDRTFHDDVEQVRLGPVGSGSHGPAALDAIQCRHRMGIGIARSVRGLGEQGGESVDRRHR